MNSRTTNLEWLIIALLLAFVGPGCNSSTTNETKTASTPSGETKTASTSNQPAKAAAAAPEVKGTVPQAEKEKLKQAPANTSPVAAKVENAPPIPAKVETSNVYSKIPFSKGEFAVDFDGKRIFLIDRNKEYSLMIWDLTKPELGWQAAKLNGEIVKVRKVSHMKSFDSGRKLVFSVQHMGENALRIMDTANFTFVKTLSASQAGVEEFLSWKNITSWTIDKLDDKAKAKAKKALGKLGIAATSGWFIGGETARGGGVLVDVMSGYTVKLKRMSDYFEVWQTERGPVVVEAAFTGRSYQLIELFHPAQKQRRQKVKFAMKKGKGEAQGISNSADIYPMEMYQTQPSSLSGFWGGSREKTQFYIFGFQQDLSRKKPKYSESLIASIGAVSGDRMELLRTDSTDVVLLTDGRELRHYRVSNKQEMSKTIPKEFGSWTYHGNVDSLVFQSKTHLTVLDVNAFFATSK